MAKFRLKTAHVLRHNVAESEVMLMGDKELEEQGLGEEKGAIVGDGTPYPVTSATIDMEPLDDEAREMIAAEEERLTQNQASMQPMELLARTMGQPVDDFERRYLAPGQPRPQRKANA